MHRHHILPRYRGGTDDQENLIRVTVKQHAMWHYCNWKLWSDTRDYCAWKGLAGEMSKRQILATLASARKKQLKPIPSASLDQDHDETMECTKCGSVTNLVGSESLNHTVRRMRVCPKCGHKFLTYEIPQTDVPEAEQFVENGNSR